MDKPAPRTHHRASGPFGSHVARSGALVAFFLTVDKLLGLVLLQTVVSSAGGIVMSVLQAHQHFLLPAAVPLAYARAASAGCCFWAHAAPSGPADGAHADGAAR